MAIRIPCGPKAHARQSLARVRIATYPAALAMTMCFDTFPASPKASYFGIVIVTTISFSVSLRSDTAPMPAD